MSNLRTESTTPTTYGVNPNQQQQQPTAGGRLFKYGIELGPSSLRNTPRVIVVFPNALENWKIASQNGIELEPEVSTLMDDTALGLVHIIPADTISDFKLVDMGITGRLTIEQVLWIKSIRDTANIGFGRL